MHVAERLVRRVVRRLSCEGRLIHHCDSEVSYADGDNIVLRNIKAGNVKSEGRYPPWILSC